MKTESNLEKICDYALINGKWKEIHCKYIKGYWEGYEYWCDKENNRISKEEFNKVWEIEK